MQLAKNNILQNTLYISSLPLLVWLSRDSWCTN